MQRFGAIYKNWTLDLIKHLIDPRQYGTLPGCSTTQALIELLYSLLAALEKPDRMLQIVFLDIQKDSTKLDHTIILTNLASAGIHNILIRWVITFLCKDKQHAQIGSCKYEWNHVKAGIHIEPFCDLFALYIT